MTAHDGHLSALVLDGLALGALAAGEESGARAHLASCATCRGEHEAATALREHFERGVFARTRPKLRARRWPGWVWLAAPVLAAAAVLLVVWTRGDSDPELGIKGDAAWQVFANRNDQTFAVHDGAKLVAGDRIRFVVTPNGARYVLVASVDGTGAASIYYPYGGEQSARITGARVELPGSIVLDATAGPERLYAIFTDEPISANGVKERLRTIGGGGADAIRRATRLDLRARTQLSIVFEKVTP